MTHISTKSSVVTLINVFTIEPANQRRLVDLLTEATEVSVRRGTGLYFREPSSQHRRHEGHDVRAVAERR